MSLPGIHSVVGGDVALQYMKVPRSRKTLPRPGRYTVGGSEGSSARPSKRPMPPAGLPPPGSGKGYGIGSDRGKKRPISPEVGPRRRAADGGGGDGGFDGGKGGGFDGGKGGGLDGGSFDGGEGGGFDGGKGGGLDGGWDGGFDGGKGGGLDGGWDGSFDGGEGGGFDGGKGGGLDGGWDGGEGGGFYGGKGGGLDGGWDFDKGKGGGLEGGWDGSFGFDGGEGGGFDGGKGGGFGGKVWQRQPRDLCWWMALEGKGKEAGKLLALPRRWKVNKDGEVVPRGRGAVNRGNSAF